MFKLKILWAGGGGGTWIISNQDNVQVKNFYGLEGGGVTRTNERQQDTRTQIQGQTKSATAHNKPVKFSELTIWNATRAEITISSGSATRQIVVLPNKFKSINTNTLTGKICTWPMKDRGQHLWTPRWGPQCPAQPCCSYCCRCSGNCPAVRPRNPALKGEDRNMLKSKPTQTVNRAKSYRAIAWLHWSQITTWSLSHIHLYILPTKLTVRKYDYPNLVDVNLILYASEHAEVSSFQCWTSVALLLFHHCFVLPLLAACRLGMDVLAGMLGATGPSTASTAPFTSGGVAVTSGSATCDLDRCCAAPPPRWDASFLLPASGLACVKGCSCCVVTVVPTDA